MNVYGDSLVSAALRYTHGIMRSDTDLEIFKPSFYERRYPKRISTTEHEKLEQHLRENPHDGKVMPGSGGLRKLRWGTGTQGKRGGVRIIYYYAPQFNLLIMLDIYAKNEREDLTRKEIKSLSDCVKDFLKP